MSFATVKPAIALFLFTAVAAVIVGFMYTITAEPIEQRIFEREQAAINAIMPNSFPYGEPHIYDLPDSTVTRRDIRINDQGERMGYVFFAESRGYDGLVHVLVGFDMDGDILGVRIISHTETPGLGTVIVSEAFISQFYGLRGPVESVRNPQRPHQIDAVTGATLSVNAVVRAVNDAWEIFEGLHAN